MCGVSLFFFQAEDGIRDLVRSRGLGDVYKRQVHHGRVPGEEEIAVELVLAAELVNGALDVQLEHLSLIHI